MVVLNIHDRRLRASPEEAGALLDSLASGDDRLWPHELWPPMRFKGPLQVGARGGHGPIRYTVESYAPGREITFRFTGPRGFDGTHAFHLEEVAGGTILRHTLSMGARGWARLSWPLLFRPLHDALMEDALSKAAGSRLALDSTRKNWSPWVRFLRWVLGRRK